MAGSRWLHTIVRLWRSLSAKSPSTSPRSAKALSVVVRPDEDISTFVTQKNQVVRNTHVRHDRLMPRRKPKTSRLERSVCRSSELSEQALWTLCTEHFDAHSKKPAIGRGVGRASAVYSEGLSFDADGKPYPEHANIVGWHDQAGTPDRELKNQWMDRAQRIAASFTYVPRSRPQDLLTSR